MKYIFLFVGFQLYIGSSCQLKKSIDTDGMSRKAKDYAIKMASSLTNRNAAAFIEFHYPKLVEMMGGRQQAIESIERSWKKNEADRAIIENDSIGNPSKIIFYKGQYQCTIPQQMIMAIKNQKVAVQSTLVALSMNEGETWYFMDAADDGFKKIKAYFPEISEELEVPKQAPAKIIK